jgi:hypothetical protein
MKKINKTILGLVLIILSSCSIDKTDINVIGPIIIEDFIKDNSEAKSYFIHNGDSLTDNTLETLKNISSLKNTTYDIIEFSTIHSSNFDNILWSDKYHFFNSYLKRNDGTIFQIYFLYKRDSITNSIVLQGAVGFNNITELCNTDKNKVYCPTYDIDFKNINWTTDYSGKTLKSGTVSFQNNSETDLNYIKFRVILKEGKSTLNSETFFNQTIESNKPSYKGDITTIQIPGMENYFTGFEVKKNNLIFDVKLIEVLPKPLNPTCILLDELKENLIQKSN